MLMESLPLSKLIVAFKKCHLPRTWLLAQAETDPHICLHNNLREARLKQDFLANFYEQMLTKSKWHASNHQTVENASWLIRSRQHLWSNVGEAMKPN